MKISVILFLSVVTFGGLLNSAHGSSGCPDKNPNIEEPPYKKSKTVSLDQNQPPKKTLMDFPDEVLSLVSRNLTPVDVLRLTFTSKPMKTKVLEALSLNSLERGLLEGGLSPRKVIDFGLEGHFPYESDAGEKSFGIASWDALLDEDRVEIIQKVFSENNPPAKAFMGKILSDIPPLSLGFFSEVLRSAGYDSPLFKSLQPFITGLHVNPQDLAKHKGPSLSHLFPNLRILVVRDFASTPLRLSGILQELPHMTGLTTLDLRGNDLGEGPRGLENMKVLKKSLEPLLNLTSINFGYNGIGGYLNGPEKMDILREILAPLTQMTALDLGGNGIGKGQEGFRKLEILAQVLKPLTQLVSLNLGANQIGEGHEGPQKMEILSRIVTPLTHLINLDLRANMIGQGGPERLEKIKLLKDVLTPLTNLSILSLYGNLMGRQTEDTEQSIVLEEISVLAEIITSMSKLMTLDLGLNSFTEEQIRILKDRSSSTSPFLEIRH